MATKKYQFAIYEKRDRIAYVTLNRPQVMNALHPAAHDELADIFADFRGDDELWVAILTGAGERAFSAGRDLKQLAVHGEAHATSVDSIRPGGGWAIVNRFECWKPLIAAVNGFALGGGFEMALACDIIIAAEHARFGLPEPTVGRMAGSGVHRLPRQLPLKVAMGYLLTGKHMTSQEALRWGLVNQVVPLRELLPTAERWAQEIMSCAPLSVRATKEAAMRGLSMPLDQALNHQFYQSLLMGRSEDIVEGPKAFAEKRRPVWKGR